MSLRSDMIGPRRLAPAGIAQPSLSTMRGERRPLREIVGPITRRGTTRGVIPGCHEAPSPQPALVLRDDLISKSVSNLSKAISVHADALAKAGGDAPESIGGTGAGSPRSMPRKTGSAPIPTTSKIPDVSTPQHEHARLTAKKQYLEGKLDAHARAMHPANHPDVSHRAKVLGQVNGNLQHLESQGVRSTPQHHYDWIQHYATMHLKDPKKVESMHPEELNTTFSAHMGALASGSAKAETKAGSKTAARMQGVMRRHMTGTQAGAGMPEAHPGLPFKQYTKMGGDPEKYPTRITAVKPSEHPESLKSLAIIADLIEKGTKSDKWISDKIRLLMHEGKEQDQAIAQAMSMAGRSKKDKAKKSFGLYVTQ